MSNAAMWHTLAKFFFLNFHTANCDSLVGGDWWKTQMRLMKVYPLLLK